MLKVASVAVLLMWLATAVTAQTTMTTETTTTSSTSKNFPTEQPTTESPPAPINTVITMPSGSGASPQAACKFSEDIVGNWRSTLWGNVNFSESKIELNFDVGGHPDLETLECFAASDNGEYILRSEKTFSFHGLDFYVYTCIQFGELNQDHFTLTVKTERSSDSNNEPVKAVPKSTPVGEDPSQEICNAPFSAWIKGDLLRKGREIDGALGCSEKLKGSFKVAYQDPNTRNRCENGAVMTTCDEPKTLVFNYSTCNENVPAEYSDADKYICVGGSASKVLLYRESEEQNSYTPFSCLEILTAESSYREGEERVTQVDLVANHVGSGCNPSAWKLSDQAVESEKFMLIQVDDCEEDVVVTTESPAENSTVPYYNATTSFDDNETMQGNGSGFSNNTGNADDAAQSLGSNGLLVTFIAAFLAVLLNDCARLDL